MSLLDRTILITGAARRLGRIISLAVAKQGADVILHYHHSDTDAAQTQALIQETGRCAWKVSADLNNPASIETLYNQASSIAPIFAIVNNASIFAPLDFPSTTLKDWEAHIRVNLTAPFLLTQLFANNYSLPVSGKVLNLLDWRALRPGSDHFPYTVSKAGLAFFTKSAALSMAPRICVNAIALGAILPPENEPVNPKLIESIPLKRWASHEEFEKAVLFLLDGPDAITGEIIHLDGGRNLI